MGGFVSLSAAREISHCYCNMLFSGSEMNPKYGSLDIPGWIIMSVSHGLHQ